MTVGRGQENDWVLPDPERLVSQKHCVVQYKDGRYYLTDCSTNGVELVRAGIRLRRGSSEPLQDGEIIRIGEYEIQARIDTAAPSVDISPSGIDSSNSFEALMGRQGAPAVPHTPAVSLPASAAHFQGGSAQDTFPDLFDFLSPSSVAPPTQPDHVPAEQHDFRAPTPRPSPAAAPTPPPAPAGLIPDDWDPFAEIVKPRESAPASTPAAAPVSPPAQPVPVEPVFIAPEPVPVSAPIAPQAVEPVQADAQVSGRADLLQAFLRGAGLDQLRIDNAQAEAQMHDIGRSYRLMVEGLIDVLRARSSLKSEFRMQQTMIGPVENNPLKFAPNADEAMLLLLRHGNQAFMGPEQAVTDSFDDLRAHQLAVMAGVQAAIKHLLKRFEPAELEARMGAPSNGLSKLFSGSRQAQYWQQFTALYSEISREAEDDFQDLFGREFSRAYEEHSARLRRP